MLGAGTKTAITTARDFPAIIDVTRLTSRVGRGPYTGVDRVELAYLEWCLATGPDLFGFAKVSDGYVLLDREGLTEFYKKLTGEAAWGKRDLRAIVGIKTPAPRGAAESDLRRLATRKMNDILGPFRRFGVTGCKYLNVGHSNLTRAVLWGFAEARIAPVVFLHDVIPIEFPQFQRKGSQDAFAMKLGAMKDYANRIVTNSQDSLTKATKAMDGRYWGMSYAHLGIDVPTVADHVSGNVRPYFVTLGTIEPRKNHALLLEVWQDLIDTLPEDKVPDLHIIGQRGWENIDVITKLDRLRDHPRIHEDNNMDDDELWPLIAGSHGLLFPSFAEGFGLPSLEAAALNVPVICGDLAIHHELLGDYPVYANVNDGYLWKKTIIEQAEKRLEDLRNASATRMPPIPTWNEHFARVNHAVMGPN